MKRKGIFTAAATVLMLSSSFASFAGQWYHTQNGSWYQNDDGSCPINEWKLIDGRWSYFDQNGYAVKEAWVGNYYLDRSGEMMRNSWTPDGYYVGTDGQWIPGYQPNYSLAINPEIGGQAIKSPYLGLLLKDKDWVKTAMGTPDKETEDTLVYYNRDYDMSEATLFNNGTRFYFENNQLTCISGRMDVLTNCNDPREDGEEDKIDEMIGVGHTVEGTGTSPTYTWQLQENPGVVFFIERQDCWIMVE